MSQRVISNLASPWYHSTPYDYCQNILSRTISDVVLSGIVFSTDTIDPAEYSQTLCFNPINLHPLIEYDRIINKFECSPTVKNTPVQTIIFPFKTEDVISCYNFIALMKKLYIFFDIHLPKPELFCKLFKYNQSCIYVS